MNMNTEYNIGQKVLLDLGNESFTGEIKAIDKNRTRIRLDNVENFQTGFKYNGIQNYFLSSIKSITPILDKSINLNKTILSPVKECNNKLFSDNAEEIEDDNLLCTISQQEWKSINDTLSNIQIIHQSDSSYFSAIKDLNNQLNFVILLEDCEFGRHNISTLITIYSPSNKNLYIFDMVYLQNIGKELVVILQEDRTKKIMFDSKIVCDHLKFAQNVEKIRGVFDVLVAYLISFKNQKSLNLISCVKNHFSLPENYFNTNVKYNWHSRPLTKDHYTYTAKKAIFLYKLYEYFVHEHLLKKFYETCEIFSTTFSNNNDQVEVAHLMSNNDETADKLAQETDIDSSFSIESLKI